jgi:hypothetical protein
LVLLPRTPTTHARSLVPFFFTTCGAFLFGLLIFRQAHGRAPGGAVGPVSARFAVLARLRDARGIRLFMFPGPCATRTMRQHSPERTGIVHLGLCPMTRKTWPVKPRLRCPTILQPAPISVPIERLFWCAGVPSPSQPGVVRVQRGQDYMLALPQPVCTRVRPPGALLWSALCAFRG